MSVCVLPLTQQQDFDFPSLLLLLLLEDPLDLFVHGDAPLLVLGQTARTGASAHLPTARHGRGENTHCNETVNE